VNGRKVIERAMKTKGLSPFIAGELSLADLYLAPIAFYVSLTPDKDVVFNVDGLRIGGRRSKACGASRRRNRTSADGKFPWTRLWRECRLWVGMPSLGQAA
jgi:glutathione S-transferase